ncbi:MAG: hypothetical protein QOJ39_2912 [Candidatus Eremiobacteraeota bacterium]|jgi:hypothetical protein|nr:hypothetical protein [Candidatus Eremiobacteraeota bacterium]
MSAGVFCDCGHEWSVHDAYGCCAFLGAYPETKGELRYCACKVPVGSGRAAAARAAAKNDDAGGTSEQDERNSSVR